jgi:hypothetical protein
MALNVNGLRAAESKRVVYRIDLAADVKVEDLLLPDFWVHVSRQMRVDDRIEVMACERKWFAELTVLEVSKAGNGGARVAYIVGPVALTNAAEVEKPATHEIRWGGPKGQWQIMRVSDKAVVKGGIETKEAASTWLTGFALEKAA